MKKTMISKKSIRKLIQEKQTNVVVSADLTDKEEILKLVSKIGYRIIGVKLHSDIIEGWDISFIEKLRQIAKDKQFLIIEDRKFCDIGNTVKLQSGLITKYADLITVHSLSGPGIIDGLRENCITNNCGILLLAQMSSKGNLISPNYTRETVEMAKQNKDIVVGFIAQKQLCPDFLTFTPGVNVESKDDKMGQQYNTPSYLVREKKCDVLIVGRGIYQQKNPSEAVERYCCL